jgi:bifunctional UDP-N-acetylglucosamine pyrophosphorylase/glucosamine-1-phosphate N-acetyltransferase
VSVPIYPVNGLSVIVLAAGKGQRMMSDLPKVLHHLGGKTLLAHVVETARQLSAQDIHVVYGNGGEAVLEGLKGQAINGVKQTQLMGTGHAVLQAIPHCHENSRVLILYGDVPLISAETLLNLLRQTPENALGLMVAQVENPQGFGRIVRNDLGEVVQIVEQRDANEAQRNIKEINTGILTAPASYLKKWLPNLTNQNQQQEYYLTDIVAMAVTEGVPVRAHRAICAEETRGINDRAELAAAERFYQRRLAERYMRQGVTIADPSRIDIRGEASIAADVFLDINVILEGRVVIGKNSRIGPQVWLKDVEIGENVEIYANCVIEGAKIAEDCKVGPFARIRNGTQLEARATLGNFVEVKKTIIGEGTKAHHFGYLGDAIIGSQVNIGAGTITCNYDGLNKHVTHIHDGAFIGSHSALVAPVSIGKNATIGAGSTITRDAPPDILTLSRTPQIAVKGWRRKKK